MTQTGRGSTHYAGDGCMPDHAEELAELRHRAGDQPLPVPNELPQVHPLVAADIEARQQLGIRRYGQALQPHNGRDALLDAYQEALDLCCYLRQALYERDGT